MTKSVDKVVQDWEEKDDPVAYELVEETLEEYLQRKLEEELAYGSND